MEFDVSAAHSALAAFSAAMNPRYGGRYWITCGTLLGAIRDGAFIKHDGDIDFGMHIRDFDDRLVETLQSAGIRLIKTSGHRDDGLTLTFVNSGVKLDIFFCYDEGGRIWHAVSNGKPQVRYYYDAFGVVPHSFQGVSVFVPDPPIAVLEANYGKAWAVPVKRWHYAYSPPNVVLRGNAAQKVKYDLKRGIWELKSRTRAAWNLLRQEAASRRKGVVADG
jgi:hypothetical protein